MLKRLMFLLILVATVKVNVIGQDRQTISENVLWFEYSAKYLLGNKFSLAGNLQYRPFLDRERFFQTLYGLGVSYRLNETVTFASNAEVLFIHSVFSDSTSEDQNFGVHVIQPSQSVQLMLPIEKLKFRWRFQMEERFFSNEVNGELTGDYRFAMRFRLLSEVFIPIKKDLEIQTGIEAMIQAGNWIESSFDQNRSVLLLRKKMGSLTVRAGYMHWLFQSQDGSFQNRHTYRFGVIHLIK